MKSLKFHVVLFALVFGAIFNINNSYADVAAAKRSVPRIGVAGYNEYNEIDAYTGSGFAISKKLIVTNYHVIAPFYQLSSAVIRVIGPTGESGTLPAQIKFVASDSDLAVLYVPEGNFVPLPLSTEHVSAEITTYSLGYPGVVDRAYSRNINEVFSSSSPEAFEGKVSNYVNRSPNGDAVETMIHSAQISEGNSGGPLIDECGRVVGINTWKDAQNGTYSFAISSSPLISLLRNAGINPTIVSDHCVGATERANLNAEQARRDLEEMKTKEQAAQIATQAEQEKQRIETQKQIENMRMMTIVLIIAFIAIIGGLIYWFNVSIKKLHQNQQQGFAAPIANEANKDEAPQTEQPKDNFKIGTHHFILIGLALGFGIWAINTFLKPSNDTALASTNAIDGAEVSNAIANNLTGDDALMANASIGTKYDCHIDESATQVMTTDTSDKIDVKFRIDEANGCLMGRTQYGKINGNLARITGRDSDRSLSIFKVDISSNTYTQTRYALDAMTYQRFNNDYAAVKGKQCGQDVAQKQASLFETYGRNISSAPVENLVWRCTKGG